eukprot:m.6271 g.6271  ORF g.6271 m.6271 type:complete len:333 (-) comp3815_c0_seq2:24-1022(-)
MAVGAAWLAGAVSLLVGTQMVMLIFGKLATQAAPLPLLLCIAQFVASAGLAAGASIANGRGIPVMPSSLLPSVGMLSAVWTAGFVLFNASAAVMSPGIVNLVRCVEPLASVSFGVLMGKTYSWGVLATLIPICGGVLLASFKGGLDRLPPFAGVALAMLSNTCFCLRPIFQQKYQAQPENGALDSIGLFFNVCSVSVVILPPFVFMLEGSLLMPELNKLAAAGTLWKFAWNVALSSLFFFLYQFTQLLIMSKLTPLEFSILTPIVKAFVIICCAIWFGDDFGVQSAIGVAVSLGGGYAFTVAKQAAAKPPPNESESPKTLKPRRVSKSSRSD